MPTKDPVLSVRLPGDLDERINQCAEKLDLSKNDIARHAIRAAILAIEANGYRITLPLEMEVKTGCPVESLPGPIPAETRERATVAALSSASPLLSNPAAPGGSADVSPHGLNEDPANPPKRESKPLRVTKTRSVLRKMQAREIDPQP